MDSHGRKRSLCSVASSLVILEVAASVVALGLSLGFPLLLSTGAEVSLDDLTAGFEQLEATFDVGAVLNAERAVFSFAESVLAHAEGALVGESARNLTLEVVFGLADNGRVIN